jgi:VIT1/CCC1 family predicted Fe2+/Mn2+ transporter
MTANPVRDDRSLGELFGDLSRQLSTLIRQEIDLARTEVTGRVSAVGRDAAVLAAGVGLLYAGLLVLLAAAVLLLSDIGVTPWLAAVVVALIVGVIGGLMVVSARQAMATREIAPRRTLETLKDDADWAKERIK